MTPSAQHHPSRHYDVAIIGAGVAGLSMAYHLSPQAAVVLLEAESQPAYHSSGRSAAMFIESYENPTVSALTSAGGEFLRHPPEGFCDNDLLKPMGGLTVAGPGEERRLEKFIRTWSPVAPSLDWLDAAACLDIVPELRDDWLTCGTYDVSWQSIDVHELLTGFRRGLTANAGVLLTGFEVTTMASAGGRWTISSAAESLTADVVINAAGAWANEVGQRANASLLPLTPLRRTAAIVPPVDGAERWPLVHTINENLYFKPESPGIMVSPQDETPTEPCDAQPEELDIAIALDRLSRIATVPTDRLLHSWAGLRTFAPDRRPVVGFDPDAAGFFWLAGLGGFGVQTAPGLGSLAAKAVLGEALDPSIDVARYCGSTANSPR